jgi:hypothetical protein
MCYFYGYAMQERFPPLNSAVTVSVNILQILTYMAPLVAPPMLPDCCTNDYLHV